MNYTTPHGLKFEYDLLRNVDGAYHAETVKWFLDRLTPDDTFVEIGAHVGRLAVDIVKNGPQKASIIVEPHPGSFALLNQNLQANGCQNYTLFEGVVLDKAGTVPFLPINDQPAMSSAVLKLFGEGNHVNAIQVRARTMDDLLADTTGPLVIKTDTEGADILVFDGAKAILPRVKVWFMEFMPRRMEEGLGRDPAEFIKELRQHFLIRSMDGDELSDTDLLTLSKHDICLTKI